MSPALTLIGVGHIGGSVALGLRACGAVADICGMDRDPGVLAQAQTLNIIDRTETDLAQAVQGSELIVLGVPPTAIAGYCEQLAPLMKADQIVTDVGSVKGEVLRQIEACCGSIPNWFVPGHPIAGTEQSGAASASADLFCERHVVLTPQANTAVPKLARVQWMWEQLGARVEQLSAEDHDAVFAGVSHLPHVLAYLLIEVLNGQFEVAHLRRYAAGGLLDFTRIASSDPKLWSEICRANQSALLPMLYQYRDQLEALTRALETDQVDALEAVFASAKKTRDQLRGPRS